MSYFISELRNAHSVLMAHQRGNQSMSTLCAATHLPLSDVGFWTRAFRLPLVGPSNKRYRFTYESTISVASANSLEP